MKPAGYENNGFELLYREENTYVVPPITAIN